jgi:hypothetical protein
LAGVAGDLLNKGNEDNEGLLTWIKGNLYLLCYLLFRIPAPIRDVLMIQLWWQAWRLHLFFVKAADTAVATVSALDSVAREPLDRGRPPTHRLARALLLSCLRARDRELHL